MAPPRAADNIMTSLFACQGWVYIRSILTPGVGSIKLRAPSGSFGCEYVRVVPTNSPIELLLCFTLLACLVCFVWVEMEVAIRKLIRFDRFHNRKVGSKVESSRDSAGPSKSTLRKREAGQPFGGPCDGRRMEGGGTDNHDDHDGDHDSQEEEKERIVHSEVHAAGVGEGSSDEQQQELRTTAFRFRVAVVPAAVDADGDAVVPRRRRQPRRRQREGEQQGDERGEGLGVTEQEEEDDGVLTVRRRGATQSPSNRPHSPPIPP